MAQAFFDLQHPVGEYLRDSGEIRDGGIDFVPGCSAELGLELERERERARSNRHLDEASRIDGDDDGGFCTREQQQSLRSFFLIRLFEEVISYLSSLYPSRSKEFAERFKYDIISSSLLSSELPSAYIHSYSRSAADGGSLPGQLHHSRTSSIEHPDRSCRTPPSPTPSTGPALEPHSGAGQHSPVSDPHLQPSYPYLIPSSSLFLFAASLKTGCTLLIVASFAITVYTFRSVDEPCSKLNESPSLGSLREMITSVDEWESVVQEALDIIELDGRNSPYNNSGPSSPGSSVRLALGSSLHTIQTQCDNVRHLLSALTSPSELSQLAPMYAPPSPTVSTFRESTRPLSFQTRQHPHSRRDVSLSPEDERQSKRQTWSGSNTNAVHSRFYRDSLSPMKNPLPHVHANSYTEPRHRHLPQLQQQRHHQGSLKLRVGRGGSDVATALFRPVPVSPSLTSTSEPVTPTPRPQSPNPVLGHHRSADLHSCTAMMGSEEEESEESTHASVPPSADHNLRDHDAELDDDAESESFGVAALGLRRDRLARGHLRAAAVTTEYPFQTQHHTSSGSGTSWTRQFTTPQKRYSATTSTAASLFTPIQAARHPHSLPALKLALQNALAAKRYACAHLLALRFTTGHGSVSDASAGAGGVASSTSTSGLSSGLGEDDPEGYWEDVRSVMGLLKSVFEDAAARVREALREVEFQKLRDSTPTPEVPLSEEQGGEVSDEGKVGLELRLGLGLGLRGEGNREKFKKREHQHKHMHGRSGSGSVSFAPLPSQFSRFMLHAEAMMQALDEAKENLEECVVAVRSERERDRVLAKPKRDSSRLTVRSFAEAVNCGEREAGGGKTTVPPSLEAYERLRRELGLALRECERGRERLFDVVFSSEGEEDGSSSGSGDEVPGLGHDVSDASDDKASDPFEEDVLQQHQHDPVRVGGDLNLDLEVVEDEKEDDVTPHLLLAASARGLPLPGAEQVFEAESGNVGGFKREKSKLTREERIRMVKARRGIGDSGGAAGIRVDDGMVENGDDGGGGGNGDLKGGGGIEKWGPGGEVVQELKDVIWRVGEKKRKMADSAATTATSHIASASASAATVSTASDAAGTNVTVSPRTQVVEG